MSQLKTMLERAITREQEERAAKDAAELSSLKSAHKELPETVSLEDARKAANTKKADALIQNVYADMVRCLSYKSPYTPWIGITQDNYEAYMIICERLHADGIRCSLKEYSSHGGRGGSDGTPDYRYYLRFKDDSDVIKSIILEAAPCSK